MIPPKLFEKMKVDWLVRTEITKQSHFLFFCFYFAHYMKYPTADFQREMFRLTENSTNESLFVVAFRGSSKSTIITTSYPIWAILGRLQKKFVLIASHTRVQAKQHLMNLKAELENNILLKNDLGPFREESDEWGSFSLVFQKHNARITAVSTEQSVRGLRHFNNRPDLIIGDDLEDLASSKTREGRDKVYNWLTSEVIPAGDMNTKLVIVGNLLHNDSLLMKIKKRIEDHAFDGVFKEYPLIGPEGKCLWPGKFNEPRLIQDLKRSVGSEIAWQREYLLKIIPEEDQVIRPEWITYHKGIPTSTEKLPFRYAIIGTDLALSEKHASDNTALVSAMVFGYGKDLRIFILANPLNAKMDFPKALRTIKELSNALGKDKPAKILIEEVAFQAAATQILKEEKFPAEGVSLRGRDKRTRLNMTASAIQSGIVRFAHRGNEELLQQILGFGSENHDDLVDAFSLLVNKILEDKNTRPSSIYVPEHICKDYDADFGCDCGKPITAGLMNRRF